MKTEPKFGDLIRVKADNEYLYKLTGIILEIRSVKDQWEDGFFILWSDGSRCWSTPNFIFNCCECVN